MELRMVAGLAQNFQFTRDSVPASIAGSKGDQPHSCMPAPRYFEHACCQDQASSIAGVDRQSLMVPLRAERCATTVRARGIMAPTAPVLLCSPRHRSCLAQGRATREQVPSW